MRRLSEYLNAEEEEEKKRRNGSLEISKSL